MVDKPVYCEIQRENAAKQNVTDEEDAEEGEGGGGGEAGHFKKRDTQHFKGKSGKQKVLVLGDKRQSTNGDA